MRLLTFIKLLVIFTASLGCSQALAHTDQALGQGLWHDLYHAVAAVLLVLILANIIGWWREKRRRR